MGISVVSVAFVVMEKSVQQLMDERMCRPGYRWNDTLKRCLAAGGLGDTGVELPEFDAGGEPRPGEKPGVPTEPIAENPAAPPKAAKGGRGSKRVNAAGIQQVGTQMGAKVSIK